MSPRYGIVIPQGDDIRKVADAAKHAEDLGFDAVWFPDAQLLWRDCFAAMTLAADRTSRVTIGSAVTSTDTRHPTVVAQAASTLREMSDDRFILGLGAGAGIGQLVKMQQTTRAKLRSDIAMLRTLLSGEWHDFDGQPGRMVGANGPVPIWMTAGGPKMRELAGEIADGVILSVGSSPEALAEAIDQLRPGLEKAGRTLDDIEIAATVSITVADQERAIREIKPVAAFFHAATLKSHGGKEMTERMEGEVGDLTQLPKFYPSISHAEDWDAAVAAAEPFISDEAAISYARNYALWGTPTEISAQVDAIHAVGVDQILTRLLPAHRLGHEEMEAFAAAVIRPRVA